MQEHEWACSNGFWRPLKPYSLHDKIDALLHATVSKDTAACVGLYDPEAFNKDALKEAREAAEESHKMLKLAASNRGVLLFSAVEHLLTVDLLTLRNAQCLQPPQKPKARSPARPAGPPPPQLSRVLLGFHLHPFVSTKTSPSPSRLSQSFHCELACFHGRCVPCVEFFCNIE